MDLGALGVRVSIRSAVLPPIVVADTTGGGMPGPGSAQGADPGSQRAPSLLPRIRWDRLVRPSITVDAGGARVWTWQPAGEPPGFPVTGVVALIVMVGGLVGLGFVLGRWAK